MYSSTTIDQQQLKHTMQVVSQARLLGDHHGSSRGGGYRDVAWLGDVTLVPWQLGSQLFLPDGKRRKTGKLDPEYTRKHPMFNISFNT